MAAIPKAFQDRKVMRETLPGQKLKQILEEWRQLDEKYSELVVYSKIIVPLEYYPLRCCSNQGATAVVGL